MSRRGSHCGGRMLLIRDLPWWGLLMKVDSAVLQNNQGTGKVILKGNQLA